MLAACSGFGSLDSICGGLGLDGGDPLIDTCAHLGQHPLIDLLADSVVRRQRDITRINFLRRRLNWHVFGSHSRYARAQS